MNVIIGLNLVIELYKKGFGADISDKGRCVHFMVIKSVNETLYGVKSDISGSKNVKRVVVESGITLNAIQSGSINIDGDTFELSDEVREAMKEAFDKSMEENARIAEMNAAAHNMVVAEQQGDAMKSVMDDQAKAIEIAGRIAKG